MADVCLQSTCTWNWGCLSRSDPPLLIGLNVCREEIWLLHHSSKGSDTHCCGTVFKTMLQKMEDNQQKALGTKREVYGVRVHNWDRGRKRSRWGRGPYEAAFYHLQNDHEAEDTAYEKALKMWGVPFILQFSGQPGQSSVHKPSNKVSAAALGLLFCLNCKQRKKQKTNTKTGVWWDTGMEKLIKAFSKSHTEVQIKEEVEQIFLIILGKFPLGNWLYYT